MTHNAQRFGRNYYTIRSCKTTAPWIFTVSSLVELRWMYRKWPF